MVAMCSHVDLLGLFHIQTTIDIIPYEILVRLYHKRFLDWEESCVHRKDVVSRIVGIRNSFYLSCYCGSED